MIEKALLTNVKKQSFSAYELNITADRAEPLFYRGLGDVAS